MGVPGCNDSLFFLVSEYVCLSKYLNVGEYNVSVRGFYVMSMCKCLGTSGGSGG